MRKVLPVFLAPVFLATCASGPIQTLAVPVGSIIVAEGDSLTYGQDLTATGVGGPINGGTWTRSATPYPETLQRLLKNRVVVLNRGYSGDRTSEALTRWTDLPPAYLTIIMYGTNDALASWGDGPLPVDRFKINLAALADRARAAGSKVILMTPPPVGDAANNAKLEPYRAAVRDLARTRGDAVIDTAAALAAIPNPWTDSVHLTAAGYDAIAHAVAARLAVKSSKARRPG
jgi:lysophospholipase L1-like esterase